MEILLLAGAGMVLLLTISVGIVAHELSHAAVLYLFGIRCDIDIKPEQLGSNGFDLGIFLPWAEVTPQGISSETSTCAMRLSAIAPLVLATPFLAVITGIAADYLYTDNLLFAIVAVGWLACAIPSPQDFSVFWHANQAVAQHSEE